jgi:spore maturation protein CgeB
VETLGDEFYPGVLEEAKRYAVTVAVNSDDDFRWLDYSSKWSRNYTWMVTTYRHIFEHAKSEHPNLILSQWACGGSYDGLNTVKDIDVSFVGGVHADRARRFAEIQKHLNLEVYGRGTRQAQATTRALFRALAYKLRGGHGTRKAIREWCLSRLQGEGDGVSFEEANRLWNRTKISFTPLNLSEDQYRKKRDMARRLGKDTTSAGWNAWISPMQVKGRVFELGLSGSLVLCDRNPALEEFYERGREYEDFESSEECIDKAKYYLGHETDRAHIGKAYYERTRKEHLWAHRYRKLFSEIGLKS